MDTSDDMAAGLIEVPVKTIEYEDSYVAFVDVLGFKEIVNEMGPPVKVSHYYSVIDESIIELTKILCEYGKINTQIMSDSIVFSVTPSQYNFESKLQSLTALCGAVSHLQLYLSLIGIWTRGGLSYGKISFHENRFVVGPALVRAVELEKIAKYPRVIIEPYILRDLNLTTREFIAALRGNPNSSYKAASFIFDGDSLNNSENFNDLLFLNFGIHIINDFKYSEEAAEKIAIELKKGLYGSPLHLEKYRWLRNYFLSIPLQPKAKSHFSNL